MECPRRPCTDGDLGLRIGGKSKVLLSETVFDVAGGQSDVTFRDPEARFDFKLPLRVAAGATFRYSRGQVELDIRYYGSEDEYDLLSSDSLATRITTDATGVPVISHPAFTPVLNQARSVVSFAFGANYSLSRSVRVHGGAYIDPSPVSAPSGTIFRAVDLTGLSGGVSLGSGNLTASLGVSSSWGTTTQQQVGPSLGGQSGTTDVSIHTFTGLYSISFTF